MGGGLSKAEKDQASLVFDALDIEKKGTISVKNLQVEKACFVVDVSIIDRNSFSSIIRSFLKGRGSQGKACGHSFDIVVRRTLECKFRYSIRRHQLRFH